MSIIQALAPYSGILLDAYGVFWAGNAAGALPGAPQAMEALVSAGKVVGILSNATQPAEREMEKLARAGIHQAKHYHFLLTSGSIANTYFQKGDLPFPTPHKQYALFCPSHPGYAASSVIFEGTAYQETSDLNQADFVFISVPHLDGEDQLDPEIFSEKIHRIAETGLPMVCINPDHFAQEGSPVRWVVRQGSIAALYEAIGGKVFYIGKPYKAAYDAALAAFFAHQIEKNTIAMIGDTPETDIRGANACGIDAILTMETGAFWKSIQVHGQAGALMHLPLTDRPTLLLDRFAYDGRIYVTSELL